MKILVCSDTHLHTWLSFGIDEVTKLPKRLLDQINILEQIKNIIKDRNIKLFAFGGDLIHKTGDIPVECNNIAYEFFKYLSDNKIGTVASVGNHDLKDRKYENWYTSALHPFINKNFTGDVKIKIVNWNDEINYDEIIGYDIVLLHKQPQYKLDNGFVLEGVDWERLASNNKLVFFGHDHDAKILAVNCFVIGSPMPLTFGDVSDRGVWIIDTSDYSVEFVKLKYPKFITVNSYDEVKDSYNYYRVLHAKEKSNIENVIGVVEPEFFSERITTDNFIEILHEWMKINSINNNYFDIIKNLITDKFQITRIMYDGKIDKVMIDDFFSIGHVEYNIDNGFTLIAGINEDFDSNGAGKSSVVDSIFWCLFGASTKSVTGDDVIRRGCKDCNVTLHLSGGKDNNKYIISRTRKNGLSIICDEKCLTDGLRQVDRQILLEQQILGFDKNVFLASCYFAQENLILLSGMTDVDKTNMITQLLGFEKYDDLYNEMSLQIKQKLIEIEKFVENKRNLETDLMIEKQKLNNQNSKINELELRKTNLSNKQIEIDNQIQNLEIEEAKKTIDLKSVNVRDNSSDIIRYEEQLNNIEQLINSERIKLEKCNDNNIKLNSKIAKLNSQLESVNENVNQINYEINELNNLKTNSRCDKCGAIITAQNVEMFINDKNNKKDFLITSVEILQNELSDSNVELNELKNDISSSKFEINKLELQRVNANLNINQLRSEQEKVIKLTNIINTEISKINVLIKSLRDQVISVENDKTKIDNDIINVRNAIDSINKSILQIDNNIISSVSCISDRKLDNEKFEFWKNAFSPKGIRTLLMDRFCNQFNLIINNYISTVSNGLMTLSLRPTKMLKSGDERNFLSLIITLNEIEVRYESLSGGEKRRVDVALCLALNEWVSMKYNVKCGILGFIAFDEVFSYLDNLAEETIATMLYNKSRDREIFVISHTADLGSYADKSIFLRKSNGITSLENA